MKKSLIVAMFIIAILAALTGCNKTDPIHNGDPVDTTYAELFPMDEFHQLGQKGDTLGQLRLVDENRPQLTANVLKKHPEIKDEKNIKFILGSGLAEDVLSGSGKTYSGEFKNELIIILNDPSIQDTLFLACGNGMLKPLRLEDSHDFGTAEQWRFTIQEGEGLAHHLPALQAWAEIANNLSIPIKDKDGKVVSQETYLNYFGSYTTGLRTGDVIDVIAGKVYDKNGNEVNFNRRQQQTKRANKALKNKRR